VELQRENNGRKVDVVSLIGKKRDGLALQDDEIEYLVNAVSRDSIDHFQIGECRPFHSCSAVANMARILSSLYHLLQVC